VIARYGSDGWSVTPSGGRGVLNDAISVYFADATLASGFRPEFLSPRAREQMLLDVQNGARIAIHPPETACHLLTTRGPSCTMDCGSSAIE